jgi:uncharacterized Zn finger protein
MNCSPVEPIPDPTVSEEAAVCPYCGTKNRFHAEKFKLISLIANCSDCGRSLLIKIERVTKYTTDVGDSLP